MPFEGNILRLYVCFGALVFLVGCTPTPAKYAASLPEDDPKWNTQECKDIRLQALNFDNKVGSRVAIGLASGLLLGPFGLPIAAAADGEREDARRDYAREVHVRCSSKPLPSNLAVKKQEHKKESASR